MAEELTVNSSFSGKGSYMGRHTNVYIVDLDTGESIGLMGLPKEIDYQTKSNWAVLRPPGKNTPNYHYTGAEDIIEMRLTWWAEDNEKMDVISRCKWLESMAKSDGDNGRPHIARIMWGTMFSKSTWIVMQAPYKIFDFDPSRGMRPNHAEQIVTFARYNPVNSNIQQINDYKF